MQRGWQWFVKKGLMSEDEAKEALVAFDVFHANAVSAVREGQGC